jgi:hypothetical protein
MIKNYLILLFFLVASCPTLIAQTPKVYDYEARELVKKPEPSPEFLEWLGVNNEKLGQKAPQSSKIGSRVTLVFQINEDGKLIDPKIWRGIGQGYDEYAWTLFRKNPHLWIPGETLEGKVTTTVYYELDYMKNKNRFVTKENTPIY